MTSGYIESYGYFSVAEGWLLCGWVAQKWTEGQVPSQVVASFENGNVDGETLAIPYRRHDVPTDAEGVIFFIHNRVASLGRLRSLTFSINDTETTLFPTDLVVHLREVELLARLRTLATDAKLDGRPAEELLGLVARKPYGGEDTLAALSVSVFLAVDEAILCGSGGLALMGWLLAKPGDVRSIRVRSGSHSSSLDIDDCIRVNRPDVLAAFPKYGFDDPRCGFLAFLPKAVTPNQRIYIEIETCKRELGYYTLPPPKLTGMAAIKRLLEAIDLRFADVPRVYDRVLGPALQELNRSRLSVRPKFTCIDHGSVPESPKFSVIVPLYGRIDFVEYQMALFSAHQQFANVEIIYVLDDPPKRPEAEQLFTSVYERFLVPFRALLLDRNVGFAPANNIGLDHAHGKYVAFLNSDVFPGTLDWLEQLSHQLEIDPTLGVIGPLLLYEDGSVQHRGMYFERLPAFGNWFFSQHYDKAMRYSGGDDIQYCVSITGACMVLTRELAVSLGGFDEVYAIGDFEDSDLCLKLRAMGLRCAVDPRVKLLHLERKSQAKAGSGWRMNLTLYNAWCHEQRWHETIVALPLSS
jgi:GT2 family glycosyltransferase